MFGGLFQIFIIFQHFYAPISFLTHCWGIYLCCAADACITTMHIVHIPHMKALRIQCIVSFHFTPHISPAFLYMLTQYIITMQNIYNFFKCTLTTAINFHIIFRIAWVKIILSELSEIQGIFLCSHICTLTVRTVHALY